MVPCSLSRKPLTILMLDTDEPHTIQPSMDTGRSPASDQQAGATMFRHPAI